MSEEKIDLSKEAVGFALDTVIGVCMAYATEMSIKIGGMEEKTNNPDTIEKLRKFRIFLDNVYQSTAILGKFRIDTFGKVDQEHLKAVTKMFM